MVIPQRRGTVRISTGQRKKLLNFRDEGQPEYLQDRARSGYTLETWDSPNILLYTGQSKNLLYLRARQGTVPISTGKSEKWLYLRNKGDPNIYRTEREVVIPRRRKVVRIAIGQREI